MTMIEMKMGHDELTFFKLKPTRNSVLILKNERKGERYIIKGEEKILKFIWCFNEIILNKLVEK